MSDELLAGIAGAIEIADIQLVDRIHEAILEHEQRRAVKMRDQKEEKVFVPELLEVRLSIDEDPGSPVAHHLKTRPQHMKRVPGAIAVLSRSSTVVAIALFEIAHMAFGVRERLGWPGDAASPRRINPRG